MKHLKILGLAAVAAMAMMAFGAGSASATVLCEVTVPAGQHCGTGNHVKAGSELDFSLESSALLKTGGGTTIATCTVGTVKGKTTNTGSTTETVKGNIEVLTFSSCTTPVTTLATGTLEIHEEGNQHNGTVTSNGARVTINFLGVSCIFETKNTDVGTLTGRSTTPSKTPTFDIAATIPGVSGFPCPGSGIWSGNYIYTGATPFDVVAG